MTDLKTLQELLYNSTKTIDQLNAENDELRERIAELERQVVHWKTNHSRLLTCRGRGNYEVSKVLVG